MLDDREFNIIIFGATSYTAQLMIKTLYDTYGASGDLIKYALAGRSLTKIDGVIVELGLPLNTPKRCCGLVYENIRALARETNVLINCVGPFSKMAEPVVQACLAENTHYLDISGEIDWCQLLTDKYSEKAVEAGVKILPCMGYDFTTYDMGMAVLHNASLGSWRGSQVLCTSKTSSKGISSGTMNTIVQMIREDRVVDLCKDIKNAMSKNMYVVPKNIGSVYVVGDLMASSLSGYLEWLNINSLRHRWSNGDGSNAPMSFTAGTECVNFWAACVKAMRMMLFWMFLGFTAVIPSTLRNFIVPSTGNGPPLPEKAFVEHTMRLFRQDATTPACMVRMNFNRGEAYVMTGVVILEAALTIVYGDDAAPKQQTLPVNYIKSGGVGSGSTLLGDAYLRRLKKSGVVYDVEK